MRSKEDQDIRPKIPMAYLSWLFGSEEPKFKHKKEITEIGGVENAEDIIVFYELKITVSENKNIFPNFLSQDRPQEIIKIIKERKELLELF